MRADGLQAAMARLRASRDWHAGVLADAAGLRFFGWSPATMKSQHVADAIAAAYIDVDALTLSDALRNGMPLHLALPRLFSNCSPITMASGLEVAAAIPVWSAEFEAHVTGATQHVDPRVRRAAYLALKSRDCSLFPCAWLVCEAASDPDPAVRDVAR
jgi:hypothetical protein